MGLPLTSFAVPQACAGGWTGPPCPSRARLPLWIRWRAGSPSIFTLTDPPTISSTAPRCASEPRPLHIVPRRSRGPCVVRSNWWPGDARCEGLGSILRVRCPRKYAPSFPSALIRRSMFWDSLEWTTSRSKVAMGAPCKTAETAPTTMKSTLCAARTWRIEEVRLRSLHHAASGSTTGSTEGPPVVPPE